MSLSISKKTTIFDKLILLNMSLVGLIILLTILESSFVSNVFYLTFFILILSVLKKTFVFNRNLLTMVR